MDSPYSLAQSKETRTPKSHYSKIILYCVYFDTHMVVIPTEYIQIIAAGIYAIALLYTIVTLRILQLAEVIYSHQKFPKLHPNHKCIRGLKESLTSSRKHTTFEKAIAARYSRSG